jgi:cytochrome c oxidase cbb3-type subunit III
MLFGNRMTNGLLLMSFLTAFAWAGDSREIVDQEVSKPEIRGGIVFKNYCVLCHGQRGDGIAARAARLHKGVNLAISSRPKYDYEVIIRRGGKVVGKAQYMPPWRDELSSEQISDVAAYLSVISDPVRRGAVVYMTSCVLCHGVNADGKGRAGALFIPRPADLTQSTWSDQYKESIIRSGGISKGRSPAMPSWGGRLTNEEIKDVVAYLRMVLAPRHTDAGGPKATGN